MNQTFPQFISQIFRGFADRFDAINHRGKYAPPKSGQKPVPRPATDPRSVPDGQGGRMVPASRLTDAENAARGAAHQAEVERVKSPLPKSWTPEERAAVEDAHRAGLRRYRPELQRSQLGRLSNPHVASEIPQGKRIEAGKLQSGVLS